MESRWPFAGWRNRCPEQMLKWTHIHQGKRHRARCSYPAGHMGSAEMTQSVQKSKAMAREQTEGCQLAHDKDWAGLLRVRALDGESESWDLCSCFCKDQRSDDLT